MTMLTHTNAVWPILAAVLLASSCTGNTAPAEMPAATEVATTDTLCYADRSKADEAYMTLYVTGASVSGTLRYTLDGKDYLDGTLEGQFIGDTLLARYQFNAEGMSSVKEVVFLRKGEGWIEGYGDQLPDEEGTMLFKNRAELKFTNMIRLQPVPCSKMP